VQWRAWVDQIAEDMLDRWHDNVRYQQLQELAADCPGVPTDDFMRWMERLWYEAMALSVRRQVDRTTDSLSLANLLAAILSAPEVLLSAPWYAAVLDDPMIGTDTVSRTVITATVRADADRLALVAETTRRCVNKTLAHWGRPDERDGVPLDTSDVEGALVELRRLLSRYQFALTGRILLSGPLPDYDWMQAFTNNWTTAEQIVRYYERDYNEG
jgi:hypothetical protein